MTFRCERAKLLTQSDLCSESDGTDHQAEANQMASSAMGNGLAIHAEREISLARMDHPMMALKKLSHLQSDEW